MICETWRIWGCRSEYAFTSWSFRDFCFDRLPSRFVSAESSSYGRRRVFLRILGPSDCKDVPFCLNFCRIPSDTWNHITYWTTTFFFLLWCISVFLLEEFYILIGMQLRIVIWWLRSSMFVTIPSRYHNSWLITFSQIRFWKGQTTFTWRKYERKTRNLSNQYTETKDSWNNKIVRNQYWSFYCDIHWFVTYDGVAGKLYLVVCVTSKIYKWNFHVRTALQFCALSKNIRIFCDDVMFASIS